MGPEAGFKGINCELTAGEEVRFGWSKPHERRNVQGEDLSHCVLVTLHVDGYPSVQHKVADLRRSDHQLLGALQLELYWGSTAQGALLSVEDKEDRPRLSARPNSTHLEAGTELMW